MYSLNSISKNPDTAPFSARCIKEGKTGGLLSSRCVGHVQGSDDKTESPLYQDDVRSTLLTKRHSIEYLRNFILGGPMKRVFLFTLLSVVFALLLTGCGGGGTTNVVSTGAGQIVVQTGDAVNDQIA